MKKLKALDLEPRTKSVYPEPFASMMSGRAKRALGDQFGIKKFGVNLTVLKPGGISALLHRHSKSEEFVFILKGTATVVTDQGEYSLSEGECTGFIPGGVAHQMRNDTQDEVHYIEIGDREPGDMADYPVDDIKATQVDGKWVFHHKDGTVY